MAVVEHQLATDLGSFPQEMTVQSDDDASMARMTLSAGRTDDEACINGLLITECWEAGPDVMRRHVVFARTKDGYCQSNN
jgi:hypothetical protein